MSRLPDHLPPPAIVETLTRYECPKCGNNCQCGVPYVPKTIRAAEAIKASPEKSNRVIAEEIGVDHKTVGKARADLEARGDYSPPEFITGRDGKSYPATKQQALPRDPASIIKQIMRLIEQLDDEDRGKLIDLIDEFYVQKLERM